ncbi:MAG: hypothetical protein KDK34_01580, partial [Leptospiraceae bacterium]|nr:hypothetical protein [Leptospiraceae bacterium]
WNVALQPLLYLPMSVLVCAIRPTTRRDWVYLLLSLVPVAGVFFWLGLLRKYLTEIKPAWVRYLRIFSILYAVWLCLPVCVLFIMIAFAGFLPMELMIRTPQQLAGSNELSYLFHINMYVAGLAHIPLFAISWIPVASTWQDYKRHLRTHPVVRQPIRSNMKAYRNSLLLQWIALPFCYGCILIGLLIPALLFLETINADDLHKVVRAIFTDLSGEDETRILLWCVLLALLILPYTQLPLVLGRAYLTRQSFPVMILLSIISCIPLVGIGLPLLYSDLKIVTIESPLPGRWKWIGIMPILSHLLTGSMVISVLYLVILRSFFDDDDWMILIGFISLGAGTFVSTTLHLVHTYVLRTMARAF